MAKKYNIEYVNFYTDGSTARKLVPALRSVKAMLPKPKKQKRKVIYVDPVAMLGMAVAVCMLVMMFIGLSELVRIRQQMHTMEQYVITLEEENEQLLQEYRSGYDLEEVEKTALALGMVPKNRVHQTVIQMPPLPSAAQENMTLWERISTFLSTLLA